MTAGQILLPTLLFLLGIGSSIFFYFKGRKDSERLSRSQIKRIRETLDERGLTVIIKKGPATMADKKLVDQWSREWTEKIAQEERKEERQRKTWEYVYKTLFRPQ